LVDYINRSLTSSEHYFSYIQEENKLIIHTNKKGNGLGKNWKNDFRLPLEKKWW